MRLHLVDNGSLRPEATRNLRHVAAALGARIGRTVEPVSLLHSHKVDPARLDGQPAQLWEAAVRQALGTGETEFALLPFFLGPSGALESYIPERWAEITRECGPARLHLHPPLCRLNPEQDVLLEAILEARVRQRLDALGWGPVPVVLVDHGSPLPSVTAVRDHCARRLAQRLGNRVACVLPASMERRPEPEYAFNDPLLESALAMLAPGAGREDGRVLVSMLFLGPGRHAGPEGDVATICRRAEQAHPGLQTAMTELIGTAPGIVDHLAALLQAGAKCEI